MTETGLTKFNNVFMPMIAEQLQGHSIQMTDYQRMCVMSASQNMYELINKNGINPNNIMNDISNILMTVASLQLNANAQPSEIYFQTRNVKVGEKAWAKTVEMGIEGDGNDAILARFGRNVKHVYPVWIVRKGDNYTPAKRKGIHITEPEWEPIDGSDARVERVVYPIEFWTDDKQTDSTVEYYSTSRELVKPNLIAHMLNSIMGERFSKIPKVKANYENHRQQIKDFAKSHTVDEILDDKEMSKIISPAWKEPQSREQMIIRKMRNNVVKKIPKDFSNGLAVQSYEETTNESLKQSRKDVTDSANRVDFDEALDQPKETVESDSAASKRHGVNDDGEVIDTPTSAEAGSTQPATSEPAPEPASQAEPVGETTKDEEEPF